MTPAEENDKEWKQWSGTVEESPRRDQRFFWILGRMADKDIKTILDVGCGPGWHTNLLNEAGYKAEGCDFSNVAINKARTFFPKLDFRVQSVDELDQRGFDAVFCLAVLNIVEDDVKAYEAISKVAKWGYFAFQTYQDHPLHLRTYTVNSVKRLVGEDALIREIPDFVMVEKKFHD